MDYRTLFIFDVVSLACYAAAISTIALRYRRMIGLRWFSASVLLQLAMTMLQTMRGVWPAGITVLLPTILDSLSFFAMYMGFHWTLIRKPLRTMVGPVMLYIALTGYSGLELLHTPFDFAIGMAPVFVCAGLSAGLLLRYGHGSFKAVSRVTAGVLFVTMMLTIYRTVITIGYYGYDAAERGIHDARLLFAMLGLMVLGGGMVLMYLWFFVSRALGGPLADRSAGPFDRHPEPARGGRWRTAGDLPCAAHRNAAGAAGAGHRPLQASERRLWASWRRRVAASFCGDAADRPAAD